LLCLLSIARAIPRSSWVNLPGMFVIWTAQTFIAIRLGQASMVTIAWACVVPMIAALVKTKGHLEKLADPRRLAGDPDIPKNSMTPYEKKSRKFVLFFLIAGGIAAVVLGDVIVPN
jgi:hypothetical protein